MNRAVILLSGGMDSSTLLHYVRRTLRVEDLRALTYLYGQKHSREIDMARWQAAAAGVREHQVVDIGFLAAMIPGGSALTDPAVPVPDLAQVPADARDQPPTYVPHRNLILLSLACAFAEARGIQDVFYGAQAQDEYGYWDCTPGFLDALNRVLALNRRGAVKVHAPFLGKRKAEELRLGRELGVDYAHTWTCYRGGGKPCGVCPSCVERSAAFLELGIPDPLSPIPIP